MKSISCKLKLIFIPILYIFISVSEINYALTEKMHDSMYLHSVLYWRILPPVSHEISGVTTPERGTATNLKVLNFTDTVKQIGFIGVIGCCC